MRKFFSLLKLQIKAQYGFSSLAYYMKNDKKAVWKTIGIGLAVLLGVGEIIWLYSYLMYQLYMGGSTLNTPQIVITMAAVVTGLMVFFFGIFHILSALFLAKDTEFLASLPISQGKVFLSKFLMVLLAEYPITLLLMLPPVIIYGFGQNAGIMYYLLAVLCIIMIPLVPLVISAFLSLLLMKIVSRSKNRDLITIVGSIIFIIAIFAGQNYLLGRMPDNQQDFMMAILNSSNTFVEFMGRAFPPAVWITKVLTGTGSETILNLVYLVLISMAAFGIVYLMASFIYQKGATAQLETVSKPGKTKLVYKKSSSVLTICKNEILTLVRTPIYALNSLVMVFVAPFLLTLPLIGGSMSNDPDLQFLYSLIDSGESQPWLILVVSGIIALFMLVNPAVSTTFSREGKNMWILKNIPVKPDVQVLGKLLAGCLISFAGCFLSAIVVMFSFKISFTSTIMVIILSNIALIPINAMGLFIDLMRPKLSWNNPQEAIKQNFNAVAAMILGFVMISIFGVVGFLLTRLNLNTVMLFALVLVILLIISYALIQLVRKSAAKAYARMEL